MTDYDLQTGDELYYRKSDESHTIAFIDEHSYQLEGSDIAKDVVLLRRRIENGEIEHRPIRADGGEEQTEEETVMVELTEEQLNWIDRTICDRSNELIEEGRYGCVEHRLLQRLQFTVTGKQLDLDMFGGDR